MATTLFFSNNIIFFIIFFFTKNNFYISSASNVVVEIEGLSGSLIVPIGVVLDVNSPLGAMAKLCMEMAVSDFYKAHPNSTMKLQLHTRSADSVLDTNFAAFQLLEHEKVQGIIGPQQSTEIPVLAELGKNFRVPIISFISPSSHISYPDNPYFVKTRPNDVIQTHALAAICKKYQWDELALLYEDIDNGHQFLSDISKALQDVEIRIANTMSIPSSAKDSDIKKELKKITTRVFILHVNPTLGVRLFNLANEVGLMREGYAWLISDCLSIFMNSMDSITRDLMAGVIGIRPYVKHSKELQNFQERFKRNVIMQNDTSHVMELNLYGLRAYDVVTAFAIAVERFIPINFTVVNKNMTTKGLNKTNLRISPIGTQLLNELLITKFNGLSGEFQLNNAKPKLPGFEIFNVCGTGERTIGFWTSNKGIRREWNSSAGGKEELKRVIWPGESCKQPKGWDIPKKLKVGIPWRTGFKQFINVTTVDPLTKQVIDEPTGFSIDIFKASLHIIPFHINVTFLCYNGTGNIWSYDDMLDKIPNQVYDMVVGDTTIWSPRTELVDFSQPYSETGLVLVVKNKRPFDMWIFTRPLRWDLWLAIFGTCILMGLVLRKLELNVPNNGVHSMETHNNHHLGMVHLSPIAMLAFPERNMVLNRWSFFVLVFWLFMGSILMQSYTANLAAILTTDQLMFSFSVDHYIGCSKGSYIKEFLMTQLDIDESRIRCNYSSMDEFDEAMSKGSKHGGIDALFDDIPVMKSFIQKYDPKYKIVGPTYRTGGFGFAFPIGSPLVEHFSKAILNITQDSAKMMVFERTHFGPGYSSQDPLNSKFSQGTPSLTLLDFAGLFIIIGTVIIFALLCSETATGQKFTDRIRNFQHDFLKSWNGNSVVHAHDDKDSTEEGGEDNHAHVPNNISITSLTAQGMNQAHEKV